METQASRTPAHLWIVGIVSALWNAVGAFGYTMTQTRNAGYMAQISDAQRAYVEGIPGWADAAWAFGVWGAVAGSLLLLARSRFAVAAFALSLLGLLGTSLYQFGLSDVPAEMRSVGAVAFHLAIWAVAIALFLYAQRMRAQGVLR